MQYVSRISNDDSVLSMLLAKANHIFALWEQRIIQTLGLRPDDDRIVSHDASLLVMYYHWVWDVIIFPRSGDEAVSCIRTFLDSVSSASKSTELVYIYCVFKREFCRCSKRFYLVCFVGLSRNTYKLRGRHGRTKESSRPLLWIRLRMNYPPG